jgi:hypothetical protein
VAKTGYLSGHQWVHQLATSGYFLMATDSARPPGQGVPPGCRSAAGNFRERGAHPDELSPSRTPIPLRLRAPRSAKVVSIVVRLTGCPDDPSWLISEIRNSRR